jgi:hypothetical protein
MKCWHCEAKNLRHSSTCWACGVHLSRRAPARDRMAFAPDAMRHYTSATVAMRNHRTWVDGIVLVSTVLFGLLLGYFVAEVLPNSAPREGARETFMASLSNGPFSFFAPSARALPLKKVGEAQAVNGVVTQVAQVRAAKAEAGREAPAGTRFVTATVVIDNQSGRPLAYNLNDWKLRDSRGRTVAAQAVSNPGWLSSGRVTPGQNVQGAVTFAVPEGESALQITFAPSAPWHRARWDAPLS